MSKVEVHCHNAEVEELFTLVLETLRLEWPLKFKIEKAFVENTSRPGFNKGEDVKTGIIILKKRGKEK